MDMNTVKERSFNQSTVGVKDEDGYWKVIITMTERVLFTDGTDSSEKIEKMALDTNFKRAQKVALDSSLAELNSLVYACGFDSLIDAREYQRSLVNDGGNTNNPITTS